VANGPGSIDVIELDAATHGLVDDARDLRDKAFFAPVSSRYKIYIIDEAHQLGPGAANALLKVVEEPPPHVIFIFATTEPDKLISTIRSRTHHYPFRLVPPGILGTHLQKICDLEGIAVAKGVIPLVVRASGGSVRDSLSILGQLLAGAGVDGVTYEIAISLLGYTDGALLDEAIDALAARDSTTLFNTVDKVVESGLDPRRFTQDILERLRDLIIVGAVKENASHVLRDFPQDQLDRMRTQASLIGAGTLIRSADIASQGLTEMRGATAPRLILELICGRILLPSSDDAAVLSRIERLERGVNLFGAATAVAPPAPTAPAIFASPPAPPAPPAPSAPPVPTESSIDESDSSASVVEPSEVAHELEPVIASEASPVISSPVGPVDIASLRKLWPDVIENVKKRRRLTWSLLSASAQLLAVDEKAITIGIVNSGARDSFVRSGSEEILAGAFLDVTGLTRKIEILIDPSVNAPQTERTTEESTDEDQLSGTALLARELGAQVIKEFEK
jgi:DNA polymerase-3 subunit gamma/tau